MRHLVVEQNVVGTWDVRDGSVVGSRLFRGDKGAAESYARGLCTGEGGAVTVLGLGGSPLAEYVVAAPAAQGVPAAGETPVEVLTPEVGSLLVGGAGLAVAGAARMGAPGVETLRNEGKHLNRMIPVIAWLCGGSLGSTLLSPEVTSLGTTWIAVFVATLTWSLGLAGAVYLLRTEHLNGMPAVVGAAACFLGTLLVAQGVGVGVLDVRFDGPTNPAAVLLIFLQTAVVTYGPIGTFLSGGIGAWVGWRLSDEEA